jgi:hypothetical protein
MKIKEAIQQNQKLYGIQNISVKLNSQYVQQPDNKNNNKINKNNKMSNKKSTAFMAFGKGTETKEPVDIKRYIGFGVCSIVAINPNKEQLEKIYGRPIDKEPVYVGEQEIDEVKYKQARVDILLKLDEKYRDNEGKPIDTIFRKSIFIVNKYQSNRDNTKFHVTDEYGNTAWVTGDELKEHKVPMYSNGPASIMKNYKQLYRGEEVLMNFFKTFLGVSTIRVSADQQPMSYNNASKQWEVCDAATASSGLCAFDKIEDYFKGDFRELNELLSYQPNNKVKVLFGVKTVDGKQYQDIYDVVLYANQNRIDKFEKDFEASKSAGAYPHTEFKMCELREYTVESTNFNTPAPATNPFDNADNEDIFA